MPPRQRVRRTLAFRLSRFLLRALMTVLFRVRVEGLEHYPNGPAVLVANHPSVLDPLLVAAVVPDRVLFMAAAEFLDLPVAGWVMRTYGCIPVKRGQVDTSAIRGAVAALVDGVKIAVFPEGRVCPEPVDPQRGAALIAARGAAAIVPIAVIGSGVAFPLGARWPRLVRIVVRIGPALPPPGGGGAAHDAAMAAAMGWVYAQRA